MNEVDVNAVAKRALELSKVDGKLPCLHDLAKQTQVSATTLFYALKGKRRWGAQSWIRFLSELGMVTVDGAVITINLRGSKNESV